MLDIKFVRENPDVVRQNIRNKFQDAKLPLVDEVIALDLRNRESKRKLRPFVQIIRRHLSSMVHFVHRES